MESQGEVAATARLDERAPGEGKRRGVGLRVSVAVEGGRRTM